jgi:lipopolysaccharide export system permease protein
MTRLDRYILRQLLLAFAFFVLIFTGVVWLTQAVRLVDTVVASGQGARVFLQFSIYVLPQVLAIVFPLSALGAALHATNRLYSESELVVMMAAGVGPAALLRPILALGLFVAVAMAATVTLFVPWGATALNERTREIRADLAGALIVERQFLHPAKGLTLYISETDRDGTMRGVFLHDQRDPANPVTYVTEIARLLREGDEARLVMDEGQALTRDPAGGELSAVAFDRFVYDLSDLVRPEGARRPRPAEYPIGLLLRPTPEMLEQGSIGLGGYLAEGHYKIAQSLLALLYPAVALVTILAGGFRRSGFGRRVIVAVAVCVVLQAATIVARGQVQEEAGLWPVIYAPLILGTVYVVILLARVSAGPRPRQATA